MREKPTGTRLKICNCYDRLFKVFYVEIQRPRFVVAERTIEAHRRAIERVRTRKTPQVGACSAAMRCQVPTAGSEEDIYIQK